MADDADLFADIPVSKGADLFDDIPSAKPAAQDDLFADIPARKGPAADYQGAAPSADVFASSKPTGEPGEFGKGIRTGIIGAKNMGVAAATIPVIGLTRSYLGAIEGFDQIDRGEIPAAMKSGQPGGGFALDRLITYRNSSPEERARQREVLKAEIVSNQAVKADLVKLYKEFQEEMRPFAGRVQNATDITSPSDFADWFAFNFGQGLPYMAASIAAGLAGGMGGVVAAGGLMGAGDIQGEMIEQGVEDKGAGLSVVGAIPYAALDRLGAAARLFRGTTRAGLQQAADAYFKRLGRAVGANAVEEFLNEAGQEIVKDATVTTVTGKPLVTNESVLRWVNAGAAGMATGAPMGAVEAGLPGSSSAPPQPTGGTGENQQASPPPAPGAGTTTTTINGQTTVRSAPPPVTLTQADLDSPLPNDILVAGKEILAQAEQATKQREILAGAGLPDVGARVSVKYPDGREVGAQIEGAHETTAAGQTARGVRLKLDDGQIIEEFLDTLRDVGVEIGPAVAAAQIAGQDVNVSRVTNVSGPDVSEPQPAPGATPAGASTVGPALETPAPAAGQDVAAASPQPEAPAGKPVAEGVIATVDSRGVEQQRDEQTGQYVTPVEPEAPPPSSTRGVAEDPRGGWKATTSTGTVFRGENGRPFSGREQAQAFLDRTDPLKATAAEPAMPKQDALKAKIAQRTFEAQEKIAAESARDLPAGYGFKMERQDGDSFLMLTLPDGVSVTISPSVRAMDAPEFRKVIEDALKTARERADKALDAGPAEAAARNPVEPLSERWGGMSEAERRAFAEAQGFNPAQARLIGGIARWQNVDGRVQEVLERTPEEVEANKKPKPEGGGAIVFDPAKGKVTVHKAGTAREPSAAVPADTVVESRETTVTEKRLDPERKFRAFASTNEGGRSAVDAYGKTKEEAEQAARDKLSSDLAKRAEVRKAPVYGWANEVADIYLAEGNDAAKKRFDEIAQQNKLTVADGAVMRDEVRRQIEGKRDQAKKTPPAEETQKPKENPAGSSGDGRGAIDPEAARRKEWREIGKNAEGETVYEDGRGVRSVVTDGVRQTESVGLNPTREGLQLSTQRVPGGRYRLTTESAETPKEFWSYKAPDTPRYEDLPAGAFSGTKEGWEQLSPGMRREIVRSFKKDQEKGPSEASDITPTSVNIPGTKPAGEFGKSNKLFKAEDAEVARAILKKHLRQSNAGIDPELMKAGMTLAGYYIEGGARSFAEYSAKMVEDLGDAIRPYLRSFYESIRHYPGFDSQGMTPAAEIREEAAKPEPKTEAKPEPAGDYGTVERPNVALLSSDVADFLLKGGSFDTIIQARAFLGDRLKTKIDSRSPFAKRADEIIEAGITLAAREIATGPGSVVDRYNKLVGLYRRQPKLDQRTSTSVEQQAYSTPAPLAFVASRLAGVAKAESVYEPTAGNGMLLIEARRGTINANELNPDRYANLKRTLDGERVTNRDAAESDPASRVDVVIANPPFGKVTENGVQRLFSLDGRMTKEIDLGIAWRALKSMKDDGRAVLIIGSKRGTQEQRLSEYRSFDTMSFMKKLYDAYNVVDHFTVDGRLYDRQGAGWPVDVIVIEGRGASKFPAPYAQAPAMLGSWEEVGRKLDDRLDTAGERTRPGERAPEPAAGAEAADAGSVPDGSRRPDRPADQEGGRGDGAGSVAPDRGPRAPASGRPAGDGGRDSGGVQPDAGPSGGVPADGSPAADQTRAGDGGVPGGGDAGGVRGQPAPRAPRVERKNEEAETSLQVKYAPASQAAYAVGTLVPRNMQIAMTRALKDLEARVGDIDQYVADKLGMTLGEAIGTSNAGGGAFSAEQIDALALAISHVEAGGAFIIGDQTGVGKGRFVAGMLKYGLETGKVPVFFTKDAGLYADMIRDLRAIGMGNIDKRILITDTKYRASKAIPLSDTEGDILESLPAAENEAAIDEIVRTGKLPDGYDMLFTTYSQAQFGPKGLEYERQKALRALAPNAMIVLDESHQAGGQAKGRKKIDKETGQEIKSRADFVREILKDAQGAVFSSATYAKNPAVMSLYFKTDLSMVVDDIEQLGAVIESGGVPLQQVVANMLVEAGQYARRERSFEGVRMDMDVLPTDKRMATEAAAAMRTIFRLDAEYMEGIRLAFIEEMEAEGEKGATDAAVGNESPSQTGFANVMHNVVSQMLLALNAPAVVDKAIALHKDGKKPIIALSNTNEAIIDDFIEQEGLAPGDRVEPTFNLILDRYLKRLRRITLKDANGKKRHVSLSDRDILRIGGDEALAAYRAAEKMVNDADLGAMPANPIDYIMDRLGAAGVKVDEITGRKVVIRDGVYTVRKAGAGEKKRAMNSYNAGRLDALVINQSGSTGYSMHATAEKGNDGKQRHMIVLQADPNIDVFMQMLGRIHRTGQIRLPEYTIAVADLAVARRPAAVLMRKMASLSANTTASKKSAVSLDNVVDFLNEYGDAVVAEYLTYHPEIAVLTDARFNPENPDGLAAKFTGRLAIVHPDEVAGIYEEIEAAYRDRIEALDRMGLNTLEAKTLELDARTEGRQILVEEKDGDSPFAAAAMIETVNVRKLGKPFTVDELKDAVRTALDGKRPRDFAKEQADKIRALAPARLEKMAAKEKEAHDKLRDMESGALPATEGKKEKVSADIGRWQAAMSDYSFKVDQVAEAAEAYRPGAAVILSVRDRDGESANEVPAVALGMDIRGLGDNPVAASKIRVRFAVADGSREITIPLSQLLDMRFVATPSDGDAVLEAFRSGLNEAREERQIITGNLVAGFAQFKKGQFVMFTDDRGNIRQGILMPRRFDAEAEVERRPVEFKDPAHLTQFLTSGRNMRMVKSSDGIVGISFNPSTGAFDVAVNVRGGKPYFLNKEARAAAGGDFQQRRGAKVYRPMIERPSARDVQAMVRAWQENLDAKFITTLDKDEARKITGESAGLRSADEEGGPDDTPPTGGRSMFSRGGKATLESLGYKQDNPAVKWPGDGGRNWLRRKQEDAQARYDRTRGISGSTTAWIHGVTLKTSALKDLEGARRERRQPGEGQYDALADSVKERGWEPDHPILVEINHHGEVFITEGNTRVAYAARNGIETIRADVKWLNGGELADGPWAPDKILDKVAPDSKFARTGPYYSALAQAIPRLPPKGTGAQMLASLKNMQGVKPAEIAAVGLDEWLPQQDRVTREQVQEYVAQNAVEVREVTKSQNGPKPTEAEVVEIGEWFDAQPALLVGRDEFSGAVERARNGDPAWVAELEGWGVPDDLLAPFRAHVGGEGGPKFNRPDTTLPGGENYREVLLTLPKKEFDEGDIELSGPAQFGGDGIANWGGGRRVEGVVERTFTLGTESGRITFWPRTYNWNGAEAPRKWVVNSPNFQNAHFDTFEAAIAGILAGANSTASGYGFGQETFRGGHFSEPNVLAHVRLNDRTDADGKRVLFVEEIQSDWHQKGRKQGYDAAYYKVRNLDSGNSSDAFNTKAEAEAFLGRMPASIRPRLRVEQGKRSTGVPDAPFKKDWHELAFRRVLKMAADEGYDRVAWTTGEQQNERYDLSKQVRSISVLARTDKNGDKGWYVDIALSNGGKTIELNVNSNGDITASTAPEFKDKPLSDVIGKDMAEKVGAVEASANFSGNDLRIGGSGMVGFYDKMLPAYANKFGKKFGATVGTTTIRKEAAPADEFYVQELADGRWGVFNGDDVLDAADDIYDTEREAQEIADAENFDRRTAARDATVHAIDVTAEMKAALADGIPLFNRGRQKGRAAESSPTMLSWRVANDLIAEYMPGEEYARRRSEIVDALIEVLRSLVPGKDLTLNLAEILRGEVRPGTWERVSGAISEKSNPNLLDAIISLALIDPKTDKIKNMRELLHVLNHEVLHFLRHSGLLTDKEWAALVEAAERGDWIGRHQIKTRYPEYSHERQIEEAIAEERGDYAIGKRRVGKTAATIFDKVQDILNRVLKMLGFKGFRTFRDVMVEAGDIMSRIGTGEIGAREPSAVALASDTKFARPPRPEGPTERVAFDDAESEARFQQAMKGVGDAQTLTARVKDWATYFGQTFTRHWIDLPDTVRFAEVSQQLRKLQSAPQNSKEKIVRLLKRVVGDMTRDDLELFTRKVILDDLAWETDQGHLTPFGLTPETVASEKIKVDAAIDRRPDLAEAVRQRKLIVRGIANDLVAAGILHADSVKNPAYYRHQVLMYAMASQKYARGVGKSVRTPQWAKREGSTLDINANLLEAEFDWMHKAFVGLATVDAIDWVKNSELNIRRDVIDAARASNAALVQDLVDQEIQTLGFNGPIQRTLAGFRQTIAIGLSNVRRALEGGDLVPPPQFEQAADDIIEQREGDDGAIFNFMAWILENNEAGSMGAAMVFKGISHRREWTREKLGKKYADTSNVGDLVARFAPEGYTAWQPDDPDAKGRAMRLFVAKTVPEHAIDEFVRRIVGQTPLPPEFAEQIKEGFKAKAREVLAVGGPRYQMVIPQELADTLTNFQSQYDESVILNLLEAPTRAWKVWTLFNPRRWLKYMINNWSGDIDAAIAGNPAILKKTNQAMRELYDVMYGGKDPSARYQEALTWGVFDSGITIQEIPDINSLSEFEALMEPTNWKSPASVTKLALRRGWGFVRNVNTYRENVYRYAAYLDYAERVERGDDLDALPYGASRREIVEAQTDPQAKAALLARDLIGDYGAISVAGQQLRRFAMPFWSFQEINLKRYYRLTSNAFDRGVGQGLRTGGLIGASVGARTTLWLLTRMGALYALTNIWNYLFFGDDEDELDPEERYRLHVNLGKWNGERVSLRLSGSLSDAMAWTGFGDALKALHEVDAGRASLGDVLLAIVKAPVNKLVQGVTPFIKMPVELAAGVKTFPDFFNPVPIKDKWREGFRAISLENEYDLVTGSPSRGYLQSWKQALVSSRDSGEAAYVRARGIAHRWLANERGQDGYANFSSDRSRALHNWRLGLRYGDDEAAEKYREQMRELGIKDSEVRASIKRAHPAGAIPKKDQGAFFDSLSASERRAFDKAEDWYNEVYAPAR